MGGRIPKLAAILIAAAPTGCGPFASGTWSDDPKNWQRAFAESTPNGDIRIIHSWYMRTPHFTSEYAWFFELELADRARITPHGSPGFELIPFTEESAVPLPVFTPSPPWFKPEPREAFEVYRSTANPSWFIFQEKNGNRAFWTRSQM